VKDVLGVAAGPRAQVTGSEFLETAKMQFEDYIIEGEQCALVVALETKDGVPDEVAVIYRIYRIRGELEHTIIEPHTLEAKAIIAVAGDAIDEITGADARGESQCAVCHAEEDDDVPTIH